MQVKQFCDTAEKIARDIPTKYQLGGWGQQENGKYLFDCVCLIKSILWGFNFSKGGHGGAIYESNGVPDVGANEMFNTYCYDKSTDFSKIEVGELVWMDGHIGIYIGEGYLPVKNARQVAEATSDWTDKVLLSDIGKNGERISNGKQILRWTHHGKFKFLEYSNPTYKFKKGDTVTLNGWLHKSKDKGSATTGEYHDYVWTISNVSNGEYPYELNTIGWCRESYLSPYSSSDYKQKYEKELLNNKDLQKQVENLQSKINKAIKNLK